MIADQIALKLRHAAHSVLEMMFMAPVLADQEFPPADVLSPILVGLEFEGQVRGSFTLAAGSETAERLSISFMGMETGQAVDRQAVIEVLGELANMLCGHFLGQLNYHETFRLSTPKELKIEDLVPMPHTFQRTVHTFQRTVHLDQGALSMQVAVQE
jgi:CheY-specific phosphatase CheX